MKVSNVDPAAPAQQIKQRNGDSNKSLEDSESKRQLRKDRDEQTAKERNKVNKEELERAVGKANETMNLYKTSVQFKIHEESGEYYARVINADTEEVIREVPPEWLLDMVASIEKTVGLLVDEMV
ncbi:MAG: flagellar protein FlaG [Firmicutes bacterium]|nr:flagellar protein FlaG [Bacillota bacterium]